MHLTDPVGTIAAIVLIPLGVLALYMALLRGLERWFPANRDERKDS